MASLLVNSDNVIQLTELKNLVDGAYLNGATVTVTIVDSDGVDVTGETWPLSMPYVASSDGVYRANLADTISFVAECKYTATVIADAGADGKREWVTDVIARVSVG